MNDRAKIVTDAALALAPEERERLYETLLASLQPSAHEEDAAFVTEIRDRRAAFLKGEMPARAFDEILAERPGK